MVDQVRSPVDVTDYDWPSPEVTECPFPFYQALREAGPVCRIPGHASDELLLSRWEDIAYVEEHPELFVVTEEFDIARDQRTERFADEPLTPWAMFMDNPPTHKLKRTPTLSMVQRDNLRSYEPRITAIAHELIDQFIDRGSVDFYAEFAEMVPLLVIMDIMGLPREDFDFCKRVSDIVGVSQRFADAATMADQAAISQEGPQYMERLVLDRHERPGDDFISDLVRAQFARDGELAVGYLSAQAHNMLFAGNITTTHMLGSAMLLLVTHPEEFARVREDRLLLRPMLEEVLRLESPVQFIWRQAVQATELGGVPIAAGTRLALFLGGGNRDDRKFADPDKFWVGRPRVIKEQLAFGRGIHLCLGAPLARLEGELVFNALFDRLQDIQLAQRVEDIRHIENASFRAPASLQLTFAPKA